VAAKKIDPRQGVARTLRRLARRRLDGALSAVDRSEGLDQGAVHAVRQQLKRLRALIRLPSRSLATFRAENVAYRDLARRLAAVRETDVLGLTFDAAVDRDALVLPPMLRSEILATAGHARAATDRLRNDVAGELKAARSRAEDWQFRAKGFALFAEGFEQTYRRMRKSGLRAAYATDAASLHEFRKQVKYHAEQMRVLVTIAPESFEARRGLADELAEVLGEHHDIDALVAAIGKLSDTSRAGAESLLNSLVARSDALELEAFRLGDALGEETPRAFRRRLHDAWRLARS
jgi:CHAD domain-containing protein